jgi:hypothetical protein
MARPYLGWTLVERAAVLAILCLSSFAPAIVPSARAAEPAGEEALWNEHLAAGEFAAAAALARAGKTPELRDARFQALAQAQLAAGAQEAARRSLGELSDDRLRAQSLRDRFAPGLAGGAQADFDAVIDLIKSTIAPTSWDDVGGPGSIMEFAGGVYIDAGGVARQIKREEASSRLAEIRFASAARGASSSSATSTSPLRKVSLPRLERELQLRLAAGQQPTEAMRCLAGLTKVELVLVYPETGDLVLAGPAEDWHADLEGRDVGRQSGRPVVQLDDLVVLWRTLAEGDATLSCSITPRQEALARTRSFLEESSKRPLKPGQRDKWLAELRERMGQQDIEYRGIDPRSRVARVMFEADYRMKLVGMGLEDGTLGVTSYLSSIEPSSSPPPLGVLRWWFAMNYKAVACTPDRGAYELRGQGVQVLSENEHLTRLGQRVHTGQSEPLNQQFAHSFTEHFVELAKKYPVYAELQNVFDLALVCALARSEDLPAKVGWHTTCFGPRGEYQPAVGAPPRTVETVVNHRVLGKTTIVAGVSGGVRIDPWQFVRGEAVKLDTYGRLKADRSAAKPRELARDAWWWD